MDDMPFDDDDDDSSGDWITTFADMATLLMAFFVLLLSFAEMDAVKYQAVLGSMREALGSSPNPELVHLLAKEGVLDAAPVKCAEVAPAAKPVKEDPDKRAREQARIVRRKLSKLIKESLVSVEYESRSIIIRLPEKGMFPGGSPRLSRKFYPVLDEIRGALLAVKGEILVAGHTDDRPIHSSDLRSNWDLSTERAVSVVHYLLESGELEPARFIAQGHGSSRPRVPNTDAASRAQNRRVEIIVKQPVDDGPPKTDDRGAGGAADGDAGKAAPEKAGDEAKASP